MLVFDLGKNRKPYAAMVYAMDRGVAQLVDPLKASNQYENRLIFFLSDNLLKNTSEKSYIKKFEKMISHVLCMENIQNLQG